MALIYKCCATMYNVFNNCWYRKMHILTACVDKLQYTGVLQRVEQLVVLINAFFGVYQHLQNFLMKPTNSRFHFSINNDQQTCNNIIPSKVFKYAVVVVHFWIQEITTTSGSFGGVDIHQKTHWSTLTVVQHVVKYLYTGVYQHMQLIYAFFYTNSC